ncbi:MAG: HNH endonuclease [Thermotogota bacterium]|nr:HNH endonuclease [Thermotogota bacterium]
MEKQRELYESQIKELNRKIHIAQQEIKRQEGVIFKIFSFFSGQKDNIQSFLQYISKHEMMLQKLSSNLEITLQQLKSIYDYFLTYPPDWEERRQAIIQSRGRRCEKCGRSTRNLHIHHITPLSKGGSNRLDNLEIPCESCHKKEHGGLEFGYEFNDNDKKSVFSKRLHLIHEAINKNQEIEFLYKKPTQIKYHKRIIKPREIVSIPHIHDSEATGNGKLNYYTNGKQKYNGNGKQKYHGKGK